MKRYALILWILTLNAPGFCQSISVSNSPAGGTWSISSLSSNVTAAGNNYSHIETSSASHTLLKVTSLVLWSVSVHQSVSSNWDPALILSVQRTGDGTGGAIILNGSSYIQLTSSPQSFFSGILGLGFSRDNIPVQYRIQGLSVMLPVKTYTTTVQYTVTGL